MYQTATTSLNKAQLKVKEAFRIDICGNAKDVDPEDERDWYSLSVGFALGKGLTVDESYELATHLRYECQYWC